MTAVKESRSPSLGAQRNSATNFGQVLCDLGTKPGRSHLRRKGGVLHRGVNGLHQLRRFSNILSDVPKGANTADAGTAGEAGLVSCLGTQIQ